MGTGNPGGYIDEKTQGHVSEILTVKAKRLHEASGTHMKIYVIDVRG